MLCARACTSRTRSSVWNLSEYQITLPFLRKAVDDITSSAGNNDVTSPVGRRSRGRVSPAISIVASSLQPRPPPTLLPADRRPCKQRPKNKSVAFPCKPRLLPLHNFPSLRSSETPRRRLTRVTKWFVSLLVCLLDLLNRGGSCDFGRQFKSANQITSPSVEPLGNSTGLLIGARFLSFL